MYLLVQGIPAVGIHDELVKLFSLNGEVSEHRPMKNYPSENFCDTLLVKFKHIQSARYTNKFYRKRHLFVRLELLRFTEIE